MSGLSLPGCRFAAVHRVGNCGPGESGGRGSVDGMRIENLLNQFTGKTILIVGDIMLDEFIWGKVARISPEAPVPVVDVIEETYGLGGSGNVAANIKALGGV